MVDVSEFEIYEYNNFTSGREIAHFAQRGFHHVHMNTENLR